MACLAATLACGAAPAAARTLIVPARVGAAAAALAAAGAGDTLLLRSGVHRGSLRIERPVVVRGERGAVVDGGAAGSVVTVTSSGATLEDLALRSSGRDVMQIDAGVTVLRSANIRLLRLRITDVLYGVNGEQADGLSIQDCQLTGRVAPLDESGEGNGIHIWHTSGMRLQGNRVEHFLDGIYLSFVNQIDVDGNRLQWNGRYGLHTMYCQTNRLTRNVFTLNVAGCALMFSNHLEVEHNDFVHNRGPRTYGLLLRDCSDGVFRDNRLADNTIAVFMDGSNRNRFHGNLVEDNGWGLLVFSSSADNEFSGNQFIQNDYPVALDMRRTSNRFDDGTTGNYWSDNPAYDLNDDGVSDAPYAPVGAFAFASKQYPDLTILAKSPAVAALGVAERVFPALQPSEAVDRFPLVRPARSTARTQAGFPRVAPRPTRWAVAGFAALTCAALIAMFGGTRRRVSWT